MPYRDPQPEDPMMMVNVTVPADGDTSRELAAAMAEEFASMGRDEAWIMQLFRTPFYAGPHGAYVELGEEVTTNIVRECVAVWGRVHFVDRVPPTMMADPGVPDGSQTSVGE